ncbi:MAG: cysteine desulfurase family protein [Bacillota bacterium]|nr:cysteine desulfurase family protein [Bacillota bacterium]
MTIYLDHTASTRPTPAVIRCIGHQLDAHYANPASIHEAGRAAGKQLQSDLSVISGIIGCQPQDLILTSGGTESINTALKGILMRRSRQPRRLIISRGEHAAVRETAAWLEQQGIAVEQIPLTDRGTVDLAALELALQQPVSLISLIHVSNESGAVNPVDELVTLRDRLQPDALLHLDAVQTFGKTSFHFARSGVDLISGSGHKIGAPKGIGWLVKHRRVRLDPLLHGGGQQNGLRSGTENQPYAAALSVALTDCTQQLDDQISYVRQLAGRFLALLEQSGVQYMKLSPEQAVPHILCLAFSGLRGETLVNALSAAHIYISSGSACSSRKNSGNPALQAMGFEVKTVRCAVRVSFSVTNTVEEIDLAAAAIIAACKQYAARSG